MYCTNCGHPNPENSRFCEQCGKPLEFGQQSPAKKAMPIWALAAVVAAGATFLGFLLPWMSAGLLGFGVKVSGLTFIFFVFRTLFSGILSYMDAGYVILLILAFLIIIVMLVFIVLMAIRIFVTGLKLLGNQAVTPGEADANALKIKRSSITGLILLGIYFLLVLIVIGPIVMQGFVSMNTLGFGFWLCVIGFVTALVSATVLKRQNL